MDNRKKKVGSTHSKSPGKGTRRQATIRDLDMTDRDQEGIRGGKPKPLVRWVGRRNP